MAVMEKALTDPIGTVRAKAARRFQIGSIAGHVRLATSTLREAQKFSTKFFQSQAAIEFSGDDVETFKAPNWAPQQWLPLEESKALGFVPRTAKIYTAELVATCGVDAHIDGINGLTACLVLHNDGLQFQQGRSLHKPAPGDWFIFDDGKRHQVRSARGCAVFLGIILPLDPLPGCKV
jgi:hypothetical protein